MQSRRDQLQAYRFLVRRALAGLVTGQPNTPEAPMRRLSLITVSGVMIAVLIAAGFAVVGLLKPAQPSDLAANTIYVEEQTGARFVLLDGELHPTLNYSSAVLAAGGSGRVKVELVSRSTLARHPRGATVGIGGVPDSLPDAGKLVRSPWTACSVLAPQADTDQATVRLWVAADGGATLLDPEAGVVAGRPGTSERVLLWHGQRLLIPSAGIATALSLDARRPVIVGTALLNAFAQGPTFRSPTVPSNGARGPVVDGRATTVGQLLRVGDGSLRVVLSDGVAPVSEVEAALLRTVPAAGRLREPVPVSETTVLTLRVSESWTQVEHQFDGLPRDVPVISDAPASAAGVCGQYREGDDRVRLGFPPGTAQPSGGRVTESDLSKQGLADEVIVAPGQAALARGDGGSPGVFVVAGPGRKFPAGSLALLAGFGYDAVSPVTVPAQLLLMVPTGAALDPDAARRPG